MSRRAARVDANHAAVGRALGACGWRVWDTSRLGAGFCDLVAARAGRLVLIEVKDGAKTPSRRRLTPAETDFAAAMAAAGVTVRVVTSIEEAVAL